MDRIAQRVLPLGRGYRPEEEAVRARPEAGERDSLAADAIFYPVGGLLRQPRSADVAGTPEQLLPIRFNDAGPWSFRVGGVKSASGPRTRRRFAH